MESVTKLEYLASRAPKVIPKWFKPGNLEPRPEHMLHISLFFLSHQQKVFMEFWDDEHNEFFDENDKVPPDFKSEVSAYAENVKYREEEIRQWDRKYEIERCMQWPVFWAVVISNKCYTESKY